MIDDHKADIASFQKEADSGDDMQVKAFSQQSLPTLKTHLEKATECVAQMAGDSARTAGEKQPANQGEHPDNPSKSAPNTTGCSSRSNTK